LIAQKTEQDFGRPLISGASKRQKRNLLSQCIWLVGT